MVPPAKSSSASRQAWLTGLMVLFFLVLLGLVVQLTIKETAAKEMQEHANDISRIITDIRRYYATNVVERLQTAQGRAVLSEKYREVHGGIPIPATLSIEIGQLINQSRSLSEGRVAYRFLSDYPFPRRYVDPLDRFQTDALAAFRKDPKNTVFSRVENSLFGPTSYRLATPVIMQTSCVTCHNAHPDSPKRDWMVGDVRGIQEVEILGHQGSGLGPFRYVFAYLLLLSGASAYFFMAYRRKIEKDRAAIAHLSETLAKECELTRNLQDRIADLSTIRDVVEHATLGVTIADARQPDHPLIYANRAFCELTGFDRSQILGRNCRFLMGPNTDRFVSAAVGLAIREGRAHTAEVLNYRRDGSTFWNRLITFPIGGKPGQPHYIGGFQIDVTAIRAAEVQRTRELDEIQNQVATAKLSSQMKSEFLSMMSHELRTPMAGVIGLLNLALRDPSDQDLKTRVALALKNAESLLTILNDLLEVTQIETGELTLESEDFALRPLFEESLTLLHESAATKSLQCQLSIDPLVPHYLVGDPMRLRQILINLLANAIKFSDEGTIELDVRLVKPTSFPKGPQPGSAVRLQVVIKDSGIGMSEETRARIFQPFEQGDRSSTRKHGGTGLGLAICKHLVELMGGWIDCRSTLGQGSTFTFEVDLCVGKKPPTRVPGSTLPPHEHCLSILVAEDAYTNQVVIQSLLESMGHRVTLVESGEAALQAAARKHYDLILMDGRMPLMDGLEATRHIRAGRWRDLTFENPHIPIIAITANALDRDRESFLHSGASGFLSKPIDEAELHQALSQIIKQLSSGPDSD